MNEKTEYKKPEIEIIQTMPRQVIAQSYGPLGMPGGPIDENEVEGW